MSDEIHTQIRDGLKKLRQQPNLRVCKRKPTPGFFKLTYDIEPAKPGEPTWVWLHYRPLPKYEN